MLSFPKYEIKHLRNTSGQDRGTSFVLLFLLPQSGAPAFIIGLLMSPPRLWHPQAYTNKAYWQEASLPTITLGLDLVPNNFRITSSSGRLEPRTQQCDLMGDRI